MTVASSATLRFARSMMVLTDCRQRGETAVSDVGACMLRWLEAIEWEGKSRYLAEAVPHFIDNLDIGEVRATLANLRLRTFAISCPRGVVPAHALPCLYLPRQAPPLVVLGIEGDLVHLYDGEERRERLHHGRLSPGRAFVAKPAGEGEAEEAGPAQQSWVGSVLSRFRSALLCLLLLTFVFNLLSLATPLFMKSIYDTVIPSQSTMQLVHLVTGVAVALLMETVFRRLRSLLLDGLAGRVDYLVGRAVFERVLLLPLARIENEPLGRQLGQMQSFDAIREVFAGSLGEALLDLPFIVLFMVAIAVLGGWLVLVPVVAALIYAVAAAVVMNASRETKTQRSRQSRFLFETVSGMRAIKFAGAEAVWNQRYRDIAAATASHDFSTAMTQNLNLTFSRIVATASVVAIMAFGAVAVMTDDMTIGALIACTALLWRALTPMQSAFLSCNRIPQLAVILRQLSLLMRLPAEREPGQVPIPRSLRGRIAIKGLAHRFSAEADAALNGVSLTIEPNQIVAITGPNGAGKSTLLNLIGGLYRPTLGAVLIDGMDIRQLDTIDLRQSISLMPQNLELMYGTVAQNMLLADPLASHEDIVAAARLAAVYDDIMALPDGFDTRLTERVLSELPEGLKQRLALARAYLRPASILLLDEPGHALDSNGDKALIAALKQIKQRATILIVTHRPSHISIADQVLMLNRGRAEYVGDAAGFFAHLNRSPA